MEPFFVAQTFEPEVVRDRDATRAWFDVRLKEARAEGGTFARYTISEARDGLLIECWKRQPARQGEPRWSLQPG